MKNEGLLTKLYADTGRRQDKVIRHSISFFEIWMKNEGLLTKLYADTTRRQDKVFRHSISFFEIWMKNEGLLPKLYADTARRQDKVIRQISEKKKAERHCRHNCQQCPSAVDVGCERERYGLYKLPKGEYIELNQTTCVVTFSTITSSGLEIRITYSKYSSVSLFAVSASIPAFLIASTAWLRVLRKILISL